MKSHRLVKLEHRQRKRDAGYVMKQIWVLPAKWAQIQAYLRKVLKA